MQKLYHFFRRLFKPKPQTLAERLSPAALAALQKEAAFLRDAHGVSVSALANNEVAGKPKAVDAAVEARF